jgi:hypothetical protein
LTLAVAVAEPGPTVTVILPGGTTILPVKSMINCPADITNIIIVTGLPETVPVALFTSIALVVGTTKIKVHWCYGTSGDRSVL